MLDNNAWERVLDQVSDGDFYRHDHRLIFRAIFKLAERNAPFDVVTLSEQLDKEGQLSQVGGLAYLGELAKNTPRWQTSRPMRRSFASARPCAN